MFLKQGNSTKTEFLSRNRILFICLIFSVILFVFAVQVGWVPHLSYLSNNNSGVDNRDSLHKNGIGSKHASSAGAQDQVNKSSNQKGHNDVHDPLTGSQLDGNKERNPFLTMFPPRPPADGERFLAYIPHSGFHNQLIALQNALLLATYLNRTLLLPPLYLSHKKQAMGWKEPSSLLQLWGAHNRSGVEYCRDVDTSNWPQVTRKQLEAMPEQERKRDQECRFYHSWTTIPWTYFFNLPKVLNGITNVEGQTDPLRVFERPVMTMEWIYEHLNIQDPDKELYFFNETNRYEFKILDDSEIDYGLEPGSPEDEDQKEQLYSTTGQKILLPEIIEEQPPPGAIPWRERYLHELKLTDLQGRPERVLHFGSLYAADRVQALSEKHKDLKHFVSHNLDLWNQKIVDATSVAEKQIEQWIKETDRAAPGFLGIHLRTEDGGFQRLVDRNMQKITAWLQAMVKLDYIYLKRRGLLRRAEPDDVAPTPEAQKQQRQQPENPEEQAVPTFLERCKGSPRESPMVFIATDIHSPRKSPIMQGFLNQFPCTMFLSDFEESIMILEKIRNPVDGVQMISYMIALMDANLAAKGREFQGTVRSTFTAYIINHLWPEYHPDRHLEE
ncbi:hypothetical protein BGZ51_005774 [Haplosporangium sp. Z 767]|nr:hypothetical protein BGZ51_005774 [Haplosporangium sp. Z 767]KAF9181014.1 hypothetical protein BGZ50_005768 [Haplosporangium sp. Z 11]